MTLSRRKLLASLALATGFGGLVPKVLANTENRWAKPPIDVELDKNGKWIPKQFYVGDLVRFASRNPHTSKLIGQIEGIYDSYDRYNQQFNGLSGYPPPVNLLRKGKIINARTSERHYLLGYVEDFELLLRRNDKVQIWNPSEGVMLKYGRLDDICFTGKGYDALITCNDGDKLCAPVSHVCRLDFPSDLV